MAVDYTYQNSTGDRTTEFVSSYKNVVTPTTGSATYVEYTYTYDANGNIVSDSLGGTLKHSYIYDEAGQLVRANDAVQNKTFCYTYDNGGNLIYKKRYAYTTGTLGTVFQTITYAYGDSNWKDRLTYYSNVPLYYDAIGNLTNFDDRTFTWSAGRQLAGFELNTEDYAVTYKYNADGLRTQKYIDDDQTYTDTTYDYIWADGKLISQTDGTDVLYFLYDSNDSPVGFVLNDSETYLYIKNLQGDITGIADENGAIIVNYSYDEWGKLLSTTGSESDTIGSLNPLRYRGYYYDTETGYYYLQSRYYNPSWGRFINADDPSVLLQMQNDSLGSNLYSYCKNNPVKHIDSDGRSAIAVVGIGWGLAKLIIGAFIVTAFAALLMNQSVQRAISNVASVTGSQLKSLCEDLLKAISDAFSKAKTKRIDDKFHDHHIVAQKEPRAQPARDLLAIKTVNISVESSINIVRIRRNLHAPLHTTAYYAAVNGLLYSAKGSQHKTVTILNFIRSALIAVSDLVP